MEQNELDILKSQRWAMLTNQHLPPIKRLRLFMKDLECHTKDLKALDWFSELGELGKPPPRQLIEQCWARFCKDFYLN